MSHSALPSPPSATDVDAALDRLSPAQRDLCMDLPGQDQIPVDLPYDPFWRARELGMRRQLLGPEAREMVSREVAKYPKTCALKADDFIAAGLSYMERKSDPAWRHLMSCRMDSLLAALVQCAQLRMLPSLETGEAFLVPVRSSSGWQMAGLPGTYALTRAMNDSGKLGTIQSWCVYSQDGFDYVEGGDRDPEIRRPRGGYDPSKPNTPIWSVTRLVLADGRKHVEAQFVTPEEVARLAGNQRVPLEVAVKQISERRALRAVVRTYLYNEPTLLGMLNAEDALLRAGRVADAFRLGAESGVSAPTSVAATQAQTPAQTTPVDPPSPKAVETPGQKAARERLASARARVVEESIRPISAGADASAQQSQNALTSQREAGRSIK